MHKKPSLNFPKRFLWGATSSSHKVEGGTHNQWTVWELENAKTRATQAPHHLNDLASWSRIMAEAKKPQSYISGRSSGHYQRYLEDFDLLEKMHMNAFGFSIEWSRVEPQEGMWDSEVIAHYKRYAADLKRRGMEPIVTLFHITLPVWFSELGGFEKRRNVQYFTRFAEKIVRELGQSVRYVVTINEPEVYANESYRQGNWPPNVASRWVAWRVLMNLAYAHNQAARVIHLLNRRYKVSIAKNSPYFYAGDDAWLSRMAAGWMQYWQDDYFLRKVVKQSDFMASNFYVSNRVYGYRVHNPDEQVSDTGCDLSPADIQYVLERLYEKYKLPIIVTENGLADSDDSRRQWFITHTLSGMQKALDNGVRLQGYLHQSLLDGFEWDKGTWARFGLVHIDYPTGGRTLRPSAVWFGKIIKHLRRGAV